MPFSEDNNYTPETFNDLMTRFMQGVNARFGTNFTQESFVGTGWYKFFYVIAQNILTVENLFAETYTKLQDYIRTTNEAIAIPKTPREGLIKTFADRGYTISIEPQTLANAGTLGVCVDTDSSSADYPVKKQEILDLLKDYTVAGLYYNGDQTGTSRLSNGQDFDFAFYLPTRRNMYLKLTLQLSQNTTIVADRIDTITDKLLTNLQALYKLGNNFEPDKYFTISRDAPYASKITLEYSFTGEAGSYATAVYQADFKDLFLFDESRIAVVIS